MNRPKRNHEKVYSTNTFAFQTRRLQRIAELENFDRQSKFDKISKQISKEFNILTSTSWNEISML